MTREKVLKLRAIDPAMRGATIAAKIGVSRQRVYQILKSEGLPTKDKADIAYEIKPTEKQIDRAAAAIFCHAQFKGDTYTARQLARRCLELALLK